MTKKTALLVAQNITRYLQAKGCNQIIMIVRDDTADGSGELPSGRIGWRPEVPEDIMAIWPNVADLLTECK